MDETTRKCNVPGCGENGKLCMMCFEFTPVQNEVIRMGGYP